METTGNFAEFISRLTPGFTSVIGGKLNPEDYIAIDLSEKNPELLKLEILSSEAFSIYINGILRKTEKKAAYGGYNEIRNLYQRSNLFNKNTEAHFNRNIHIGLDVWAAEGTAVLAALEGELHSFRDNANFGDYGPTIILKHSAQNRTFYTLYGHLSRCSLQDLKVGQIFTAGAKLGFLGGPSENGDYAPHLHFQVMEDMMGHSGDFPGVASKNELEIYLKNCPDPNLLLKMD